MRLSEQLIAKYAKRIYGFAYAKTHNMHNAEDLSQNILLALCDERIPQKGIENMDAYVWRICQYAWSKYLRSNKPQWDASSDEAALYALANEDSVLESIINKELFDKLNQEIMYLSRLKREITILFYYDNKTGEEISSIFSIPASTVRWHLSQAKIALKERIVMTQSNGTFYRPIKLCNGRRGWGRTAPDPCWLDSDVLIQNICWVCHGKALTIEEMAQTLGVAAVYLEDKLERLLYMDYFKKVGKNRYQTNFFIPDGDYQLFSRKLILDGSKDIARIFSKIVEAALPEIKSVIQNEYNDNLLRFMLLALAMSQTLHDMDGYVSEGKNLHHGAPYRRDGSKRWAVASVPITSILEANPDITQELKEYSMYRTNSISYPQNDQLSAVNYDAGFTPSVYFLNSTDLSGLKRIHTILINSHTPNDYDKEIIAGLCERGCVSHKDGVLQILVPYLTVDQKTKVDAILKSCYDRYFDRERIFRIYENYIDVMSKKIPEFVDENERRHLLTSFDSFETIFFVLIKSGYLHEPSDTEKQYLCTVVWEK